MGVNINPTTTVGVAAVDPPRASFTTTSTTTTTTTNPSTALNDHIENRNSSNLGSQPAIAAAHSSSSTTTASSATAPPQSRSARATAHLSKLSRVQRIAMVELDSLPTYDPSNLSAPSYTQATAAPFPPTPCTLNVKNESKSRLPILFYHPDDEDERIIFEITPSHADETRSSSTGSSPSSGRSSPTPDFRSVVHVNVASESRSAYAVRRHVPSGTYEIVELGDDGSPAKCRKMVTRGIFKSKFAFEGLDGNEWAWKGSAGRSCELYEYQASGKKSLIADYVKSAVGSSTISFKVSPSEPALAIASLFPLIDMHRLELQSSYTTDEQLAQLQREVKPSAWDAYFLSAGQGTAKQEKFKLQLARERERSRSASRNRAVADGEPGEVGPAPVLFHPPTFNGTAGLVGRIEEDGERGRGRTK